MFYTFSNSELAQLAKEHGSEWSVTEVKWKVETESEVVGSIPGRGTILVISMKYGDVSSPSSSHNWPHFHFS